MKLQGKAAVVTGGTRGVGRATALDLARGGCDVLINYSSSKEEAEGVAHEVEALGVKALPHQTNIADDAGCRAKMDTAAKEFGHLDILVNNAGTTKAIAHSKLEEVTEDVWDLIIGVNVRGTFQCCRAAKAHMDAAGHGEIVNVSSIAGVAGMGSSIPYCASKAAVNNLTVTLARVLGPTIRVNCVAPGFIEGSWLKGILGDNYDKAKAANEARAVLGNVSQPEDVAASILSFITGSDNVTAQHIVHDGGFLIGPKLG